ncbi:hypothetical protein H0H81_003402 [Sphagnurus paluster]|uniref:F-box domain-containing protein n=1 Tax=Sphagnurus paluster TaxID=117069 RepID=A0A9P7GSU8_9AGAR|nr:hypothetical protein H0H81_003402 [Sphagnurus paluster]
MATLTLTELRPRRISRSFSLQLSTATSPFLSLPIDLVLAIFQYTTSIGYTLNSLALVSKSFSKIADSVIYRAVILDSIDVVRLFHRTVKSKTRAFLTEHVRKFTVTRWHEKYTQIDINTSRTQIREILAACPGIRVLSSPSFHWPVDLSATQFSVGSCLTEINIQSFDPAPRAPQRPAVKFSERLTHLRICEPSDMWCSPTSMLAQFGPLPLLSHLQLARRANSNEANDVMFVNSIRKLLPTLPALKMLVVSIFPAYFSVNLSVQDSTIWKRMCVLREEDERIVVLSGQLKKWKEGGRVDRKGVRSEHLPQADFWIAARSAQIV